MEKNSAVESEKKASFRKNFTVALVGNPNSGKTTLFNVLTGLHLHVGNYPGVTVELREETVDISGRNVRFVDLPGIYSLSASSPEELITRRFILEKKPELVLNIVDAGNLERNLYLTIQLIELGAPVCIALNMMDIAESAGLEIDVAGLEKLLRIPIVPIVARSGRGVDKLKERFLEQYGELLMAGTKLKVRYQREIEEEITRVEASLEKLQTEKDCLRTYYEASRRWMAIKLLEGDRDVYECLKTVAEGNSLIKIAEQSRKKLETLFGESPEIVLAEVRYGIISGACRETVKAMAARRHELSDRIDDIVTHRVLAFPVFLFLMYLVFWATFTLGGPPMEWMSEFFENLSLKVAELWPKSSESILRDLVTQGIIGGVGGVLVFLPNIFFLFLAIALLEDTGYMSRAAFIMDRLMHRLNLHGKSFIPVMIGFGCTVPAIMATRTLENRLDRLTTILILPLVSCGARLPIYTLFIPAFFPPVLRAPVLFSVYLTGIFLAILLARFLRSTFLRGEGSPFIMELPPYLMPTLNSILRHTWERIREYLQKAGTLILAVSILLWALAYFPRNPALISEYERLEKEAMRKLLVKSAEIEKELSFEPGSLVSVIEARLELEEARRKCWPHEKRRLEAEEKWKKLHEQVAGGKNPVRFLDLADTLKILDTKVEDAASRQDAAGKKVAEAARHAYLMHEEQIDLSFTRAANRFGREIFPAYLNEIEEIEARLRLEQTGYSYLGRIGRFLEPLMKPAGFDSRLSTALLGAIAAKEAFVAQLGIAFSSEISSGKFENLAGALASKYTPLQALSVLIFCLVAMPCVATFVMTWRETGSFTIAFFQYAGLTFLGWLMASIVYQTGRLFV